MVARTFSGSPRSRRSATFSSELGSCLRFCPRMLVLELMRRQKREMWREKERRKAKCSKVDVEQRFASLGSILAWTIFRGIFASLGSPCSRDRLSALSSRRRPEAHRRRNEQRQ